MLRPHVGAIEFLLSESFLDPIILEHLTFRLHVDFDIHILKGIVPTVDPCPFESDCIGSILYLFSLLLTCLIDVCDRIIYNLFEGENLTMILFNYDFIIFKI